MYSMNLKYLLNFICHVPNLSEHVVGKEYRVYLAADVLPRDVFSNHKPGNVLFIVFLLQI